MADSLPIYVCAQLGARRGYTVPAALERAGMLDRFYTDLAGNVGIGQFLSLGRFLTGKRSSYARLAGRKLPDNIRPLTRTFAVPHLRRIVRSLWTPADPTASARIDLMRSIELGTAALRDGFGRATHYFTMTDEFSPLKIAAKAQNLTVVSEIFILTSVNSVMARERELFPGWEPFPPDHDRVRRELLPPNSLFNCVDYYVCPSQAVIDDLIANWNVRKEQTIFIPYGMSSKWLELEPKTVPGRILFVGSAELRKGIHYLAMAAKILRDRGRNYEFRVAGNVTPQLQRQPLCQNLTFLGRVPRHLVHEEFQAADIFVLPSLAEGSAEVTYEALGSALPVITTHAAGSVARDGVEGRIIPERDAEALANAIDEVIQNRSLRRQFAEAARERAKAFTWERYSDRLVTGLRTLSTPPLD